MSVERECLMLLADAFSKHVNPDIKIAAKAVISMLETEVLPFASTVGCMTIEEERDYWKKNALDWAATANRHWATVQCYRDLLGRASAQLGETHLAQQIDRALERRGK